MLITHQHPHNRSMMVAVVGKPNVGKSSLINSFLQEPLAAVTPVAQTTRNRYHCVFRDGRVEVIFVDTPGIHQASIEMNKRMNEQAVEGAQGCDLQLVLLDLSQNLTAQWKELLPKLSLVNIPTWLVFTKADKIGAIRKEQLSGIFQMAQEDYPALEDFYLSTYLDGGINPLKEALVRVAPEGPHLYPGEDLSNKNFRFFVTEYIREAAAAHVRDELPHEMAVVVNEYEEQRSISNISATILVNRPGQRAIIVGRQGAVIKAIGTAAREKIEKFLDHRVFLNLHVKVSPKWFKNNSVLEELGLPRAADSTRVWRKR